MTPASYIQKPPRYTAVQWDGTEEAATWIVGLYRKGSFDGTDVTFTDALDRERTIARGTWVVRDDASGAVTQHNDEDFQRRFEPA